jgi:CHAT domain-containing protein
MRQIQDVQRRVDASIVDLAGRTAVENNGPLKDDGTGGIGVASRIELVSLKSRTPSLDRNWGEDKFGGDPLPPRFVSNSLDGNAAGLAASDAHLVIALSELQWQAQKDPDLLLRTVFTERARALLVLASQMRTSRNQPEAALYLSNRARQVALQVFSFHETGGASDVLDMHRFIQENVHDVPAGVTIVYQDLESDRLLTWVIRDGRLRFSASPVPTTLLGTINEFRSAIGRRPNDAVIRQARGLFEVLLGSVRHDIAGSGLLVYSPAPALRGLPIGALHDGDTFLVKTRPIVVTRALNGLKSSISSLSPVRSALIALPSPPPGSSRLEGAAAEAAAVASLYGTRSTSLLGEAATPGAFLRIASNFDLIHIGTHGQIDRQPLGNAMDFTSGRIRAYDVMTTHLSRAPIVVLAGCRTDDEGNGRIPVSFASAFIAAGASAVVGSLWDVEDASTRELMIDFHRALSQGRTAADALRAAQKTAIDRNRPISSWAAFQVQM